jgi:hypothetical protein
LLLLRLVELFSAGQLLSEALDSQEERVRAMVYLQRLSVNLGEGLLRLAAQRAQLADLES